MRGGGAGDRPGQELALQAGGDRHVRRNAKALSTSGPRGAAVAAGDKTFAAIRALRANLFDLKLSAVATIRIVIAGDDAPPLVMFAGEPFLLGCGGTLARDLTYLQARAYHADIVIAEAGA